MSRKQKVFEKVVNSTQKVELHSHVKFSPKNEEQKNLINILDDDKKEVIFVRGKAGTGKTLCSIAIGLTKLLNGNFNKLILFKSLISIGKSMGALPGEQKDKVKFLFDSFSDNVELICQNELITSLIGKNKIEMNSLEYIRGRSLNNAFVIIEEAQNLSDFELFTILTRKGEKTKMVILYDPYQSDLGRDGGVLPFINNILYYSNLFPQVGYVELIKSERGAFVESLCKVYENYKFSR